MMKRGLVIVILFFALTASAQLNESFADGDFTNGVVWTGTAANWLVVTSSDVASGASGSNTLRLNAAAGGTDYLSTHLIGSWGFQQNWTFWMGRRAQAATAANVCYVWLYANEQDVTSVTVDGYRIRFGDDLAAGDRIFLESVTNGTGTSIISSAGALPNGITDYGFMVRVTRDATGLWNLYSSTLPSGSGTGAVASDLPNAINTAIFQGSVVNNAITNMDNGYLSFAASHSTGTTARAGAEFDQLQLSIVGKAPLPVRFGNVNAYQSADGNRIQWTNETETDMAFYAIEGSDNGMVFSKLGELNDLKNTGGPAAYQYLDPVPRPGLYYYRVKAVEISGKTVYSNIIRMAGRSERREIRVYPNPAIKNTALEATALPPGVYSLKIYDQSGRIMFSTRWDHWGGSVNKSISLKGWEAGNYFVVISGSVTLKNRFVVQ